jgi:hypothetical protein
LRLLRLRSLFLYGAIAILLILTSASPLLAQRSMLIQASLNPTQTDRGVSVIIIGRVFETYNQSVANAVISVQVNNPQGTSIHVAIAYSNLAGIFQDSFQISPNSPGGNYTVFLVADKPGYNTAHQNLVFAYSSPDFSVEASLAALSIQQGQSASLTLTFLSLRGFNEAVNLTAIDAPAGVTFQFNPGSVVPSGSASVTVLVSNAVHAGNYTISLLAVSGSLSHKVPLQLTVTPGPPTRSWLMAAIAGMAIVIMVAVAVVLRSRTRSRREEVLDELLKQASADTGYVATARVIARLEELRAMGKVDESTYESLRKEYEKRLERSR